MVTVPPWLARAELCLRDQCHKYLKRYASWGIEGNTLRIPGSTDEAMVKLIVKERGLHRTWGPKKLEDILLKKPPERPPARSTIGDSEASWAESQTPAQTGDLPHHTH